MKNLLFTIFILSIFCTCQPINESPRPAKKALYDLFEKERNFADEEFPTWNDTSGVAVYHDLSAAAEKRRAEKWEEFLKEMEGISKEDLSEQDQINYDMFEFILKDKIAQVEFESYLTPISADGGFHINFIYMRNSFPFNNKAHFERYIKILEGFKGYVGDNIALMKEGLKKGKTLPKAVLNDYESYLDPHIVENFEESYFYEPFLNMPSNISNADKEKLKTAAKAAVKNSVVAGYQAFKDFLVNEYRPNAADEVGISAQPNGKKYYQQRIDYFTTLNMSADDVFQKGQEEVARIKSDMMGVIEEVGYKGSFEDFLNFLRTDPQFYAVSARHLLMEASYHSKRIDGKLPEYFNTLPRLPYGVDPVPDAIAPKYTTGRYSPGNASEHKSGTYWVNTFKLESRPFYVLPALTLHEAVPGHHLQISLADEMEEVPDFRRETYLSCYGEGWALYCEYLGDEMGVYETPYEHFGRMTYEMWRACRLVVDVGLHTKGWTRDEAVEFMASNTALSLHEVNTEIDRYIGWPGQAVSYKIGELKIRELRKKAEDALGDNFDIREFHEVVLRNGSVPLFVLEDLVEKYLEEKKNN